MNQNGSQMELKMLKSKFIWFVFAFLLISQVLNAQFARIEVVEKHLDEENDRFEHLIFEINGVSFDTEAGKSYLIPLNRKFDQANVYFGTDTLQFLLKMLPNETYILEAGCCCADFILKPQNNARHGTISVNNQLDRPLFLALSEANIDSVAEKSLSVPIFAHESAMCFFKPSSIVIAEIGFGDEKFQNAITEGNETLLKAQEAMILHQVYFHFLHGEKIGIHINRKNRMKIRLKGYLSEQEMQKAMQIE